jgi:hypothetical protein
VSEGHLERHGATAEAFTFQQPFEAPSEVGAAAH